MSDSLKCTICGTKISNGWVRGAFNESSPVTKTSSLLCDDCATGIEVKHEFRICDHCGLPMDAGMTDLVSFYAHASCFEDAMNARFVQWRQSEHEGMRGGYYEYRNESNGTWQDTGIFYTEWE